MEESKFASTREMPTSVLLLAFLLVISGLSTFIVTDIFHTAGILSLTILDEGYKKIYQSVTEKVPTDLVDLTDPALVSERLTTGKLIIGVFSLVAYALAVLYVLAGIGVYKLKKWSAILTVVLALLVIAISFIYIIESIPVIAFNVLLLILAIVSWRHLN
jgi:hypothetical protein